ncbi:MAG: hypothetical protein L0Y58_08320 [Verrucomicrobia subdivision 3 bacterium]|nr:hypothetical protein [Limisphaerales bacterium]
MNLDASLPPVIQVQQAPAPTRSLGETVRTTAWKTLVFLWKYTLGALFCLSIAGSLIIIGWSYRLAQRSALRYWWARSEYKRKGTRLADHLARHDPAHEHLHWPNWFARQNFRKAIQRMEGVSRLSHVWSLLKASFHSLAVNLKTGVQGIFNTWVLTMPACILWLFSWYDGWNNSFNKGYEQAFVGPATGWLGIMLFMAVMLYLPLAQARQAVTGDWRSFYNFSFVWGLVRRHWLACLLLAILTSAFFLPVMILKTAPAFFGMKDPNFPNTSSKQVIDLLNSYFFYCAFLVFPLYVCLRVIAARIYARAVLHGVQTGEISVMDLTPKERMELQRLNLIQVNPPRSRHVLLRVAKSTTSLAFFCAGLFATGLVWFTFVAQIYISEFLNYHPVIAWLNQPLIQLPWFRYVPAHAQNPAGEFFLTILLLSVLFGAFAAAKRIRAFFAQPRRNAL